MIKVSQINFGNNSTNTVTNKDKIETKEYPITYEQFKNNSIAGSTFVSIVGGCITAGVMKLLKFSKSTAITGGLIIGGSTFLLTLILGLNGEFKRLYLKEKQKFENPKPKTPIILSDFEPEN